MRTTVTPPFFLVGTIIIGDEYTGRPGVHYSAGTGRMHLFVSDPFHKKRREREKRHGCLSIDQVYIHTCGEAEEQRGRLCNTACLIRHPEMEWRYLLLHGHTCRRRAVVSAPSTAGTYNCAPARATGLAVGR
jgi:hypothetical protein